MSHFIYKVRDKNTGNYLEYTQEFVKNSSLEYKTEAGARSAIDVLVHHKFGYKLRNSQWRGKSMQAITAERLREWFPYDLEIVKIEVKYSPVEANDVENVVKNMIIANKLQDVSYSFSDFWSNATKKGYESKIQFIFKLNIERGIKYADAMKEAREKLRLLGIKGRTYREYNGMFGFYDRDQAFKARLTLDVFQFIDIEEVKKDLFDASAAP